MVSAAALGAQCPTPAALEKREKPLRVQWDVGNLLVTPDSIHGVSLWFATNQRVRLDGQAVQRQFDDRFVPDALIEWLIYTRQLLDLKAPLPNDTSTAVTSGYLRGLDGGIIVVARLRKGKKLSGKTRVLMAEKDSTPVLFEMDRSSVDTLLDVSEAAAQRSGYRPTAGVPASESQPGDIPVQPIPSRRSPRYPVSLQQRAIEGEVWTRYCVGVDGRVDMSTFWAPLSDDEEFEKSAREYLAGARYEPARRNGVAIGQMVAQRFIFGLRR
jgi:hypothetical protein